MSDVFDLIVVGGGPAGYVAAIRAAQLGFRTALVEREKLGGVCLNRGCIPTKALLHGADIAHTLAHAEQFGFRIGSVEFDLGKLVQHSRKVAEQLSGGIGYLLKKNGVTSIAGEARVSGKCELTVTANGNDVIYRADHIVIATGARARVLPALPVDGEYVWDAYAAMTQSAVPARVLVVGAGAIGVEFASLYRDLGSDVTLVEALDRILPAEDEDIAAHAQQAFTQSGIRVITSARVEAARVHNNIVDISLFDKQGREQQLQFDRAIVAVGITGNCEALGLEALGVAIERGFIKTAAFGATGTVGLYAIGDVAGPPWLAHKASHEAVLCVEKIAGLPVTPLDRSQIPGCTYCRPQIASVGLTEAAATACGLDLRIGRFPFSGNGKALALGDSAGFVKTIFDQRSGELLGAHLIGHGVTELIQGFVIARALEATEADLAHMVFPHPTLSEAMHESVLDALGHALHR